MVMKQTKYDILAKNTLYFTIGSFGSKLLSFLLLPLYTNILSTDEYGQADLVLTVAALAVLIVSLNIADAVLRFSMDPKLNSEEVAKNGVLISLIGSLLFGVILIIVKCSGVIQIPNNIFLFLFFYVLISSLLNVASSYLNSTGRVKKVAISGIVNTLSTIISNIVTLAYIKIGLTGYLFSLCVGQLIAFLYCVLSCRDYKRIIQKKVLDQTIRRDMLSYSVPLLVNGIAWWINTSLDKFFILWLIDTNANGIYAISQKIPTVITLLSSFFLQALNISTIKEFESDNSNIFLSKTYNVLNTGLVLCCSSLMVINIPIARFLYAKDFFQAWKYVPFLLISIVFNAEGSAIGYIFNAVKNTKVASLSTAIGAIVNLVFNAILIPQLGIQGAAIATAVSFFFVWIFRLFYSKKYIKWDIRIKTHLISYVLLVIQAICGITVFENLNVYIIQIIIILFLVWLYKKDLIELYYSTTNQIKEWTKSRTNGE